MSPTDEQSLSLAVGGDAAAVALLVPLVVALAIYLVVVPLGLRGIFDALGAERSRAWIPFVNLATVYRLGGLSEFWLIALVIPVSSWLGAIMLFIASHRINRRLGRSGWYTVLAVVLWWAWTLVLGLQRRIDLTEASEPLIWSAQRPPQSPLTIPDGDDSAQPIDETPISAAGFIAPMPGRLHVNAADSRSEPTRAPQPIFEEPPAAVLPIAPEQREAPRLETVPDAPPALSPDTIIRAPQPVLQPEPEPVQDPAPEASAPPVLAPAPVPVPAPVSAPAPDEDATIIRPVLDDATIISSPRVDETVISPRRRQRWWVQTSMGARVELTGASAILGRRPAAHPLYSGAQLIAVTDDALSVSATHAVLEFVGGNWHVTDLDSTNGVWLIDPQSGEETELGARNRARIAGKIMLGELGVEVVQGA
ncbi:DUF5684 domain-containing protein [Gryllotalpicola koreensis]|uniref:FHA domain-containing protein n=1 Tax=Gryllotalpicola koreensis TaxID=993086 RepID=A0ABP8A4R3_9MICO